MIGAVLVPGCGLVGPSFEPRWYHRRFKQQCLGPRAQCWTEVRVPTCRERRIPSSTMETGRMLADGAETFESTKEQVMDGVRGVERGTLQHGRVCFFVISLYWRPTGSSS